ncbi:AT-hook motif nuclear localized protein 24 [Hibiscus trionum]|uniref:AT-hook motif nuclear-localized protein n=1 Tax=Hibiscus trionum TaxID=183268 RepID=A0A9W7GSC9_HIBTR|nr:AT-hook motif nuclear localized protein 24 [Hibiscus trionum]
MDPVTSHALALPPFDFRDFYLHHHHQQQHQQQQDQFHHQTSEDEQSGGSGGINKRDREDSNNSNGSSANKECKDFSLQGSGEGELNRRPRGRPAGSKNKPKPPLIITRDTGNALRIHVMEIGDGCDIVMEIGTGTATNVTLLQPASADAIFHLHGRFEILSLAGSFLPPPAPLAGTGLTICLGRGQAQVVGGSVVGTLTCSGPVVIMAATFSNAAYERLPLEEDEPQLRMQGGAIGSPTASGGQLQQQEQQVLAESNAPYFHGLETNLLNSIKLPNEAFWASGRHPF